MFITEKLKSFSWINVGNPDHDDFERLQTEYKIDEDTKKSLGIFENPSFEKTKKTLEDDGYKCK